VNRDIASVPGHDIIHEREEILAFLGPGRLGGDASRLDVERGKQVRHAVARVGAGLASNHRAPGAGKTPPALQRLNRRLFVHTEHDSVHGRVQVQANDIGRFLGECGVFTDAP